MRYYILLIIIALTNLTACSTLSVNSNFKDPQTVLKNKNYQLRVQSRNQTMDKLIYKFAYDEFGKYIPISEKAPYSGTVDILLFKTSEYSYLGPHSLFATVDNYGGMWYVADGYIGRENRVYTVAQGIAYNEEFSWQNTTVLVTIRDNERKKLWSAQYKYWFDTETPGWFVNTASEIADICIKRIGVRMKKDFRIEKPKVLPTRNYRERDK